MDGRCMRCKENKEMKEIYIQKPPKGGYMVRGKCVVCDCNICKMASKDTAAKVASENNIPLPQ